MQTATVEVKYVNPPKAGKQYGSIKDVGNNSWPVKADRIGEFEPDGKYEIAYTESDNGFRNIIGVKRVIADTGPSMRGEFTKVSAQPRNGATLTTRAEQTRQQEPIYETPKASTQESIFVCGGLYRDIEANRVGTTEDDLVERTILWRNVYRRAFPE